MRGFFYLFAVLTFVFCSQIAFPTPALADCSLTLTLRTGSRGLEVKCLQEKVGAIADGKFGPLTKSAVMIWQLNNQLAPDGIVGPLSRAVFNSAMAGDGAYPVGCISAIGYSSMTGTKCDGSSSPSAVIPLVEDKQLEPSSKDDTSRAKIESNLVNLDEFIETVVRVNRENGFTEKDLQFMADSLREEILNSDIDYKKEFERMLEEEMKNSNLHTESPTSFFKKFTERILTFLGINPSTAYATTVIPFGGRRLFSFFCKASLNWMIVVSPLPPSYAVLLSYIPKTQLFASYNIPIAGWLIGTYSPPGACLVPVGPFIVTIPTEGTILPKTGSSPAPL